MPDQLDLQQLARDSRPAQSAPRARRRPIISRYVLPGGVLLGFAALIAFAARDQLVSAKPVTVVPVIVSRAEVRQAGTPLFQAAGWVEPRPTPVLVPALTAGILDELLVVEGDTVNADQPIARMIDVDARLAMRQAEAALALREAERDNAQAELAAAEISKANPVRLEAVLAESELTLAQTETELARLPFLIRSAQAQLEYAQQNLAGKREAITALAGRSVQQAQSDYDSAMANLEELQARKPQLQEQARASRRRRDALKKQLDLLIEETRQVATAQAKLAAAQQQVEQARLDVEAAQLRLERMTIRAPIAGRVLSLVARPGSRLMGQETRGDPEATTVVTLYDPDSLQVRADVRLEDVPYVEPHQPVLIETASVDKPMQGTVLYPTSQANIQKNTLEVKVAIDSPPETIRAEMLVTATFLAPEQPESTDQAAQQQERLLIPRQLVKSSGESHTVWIADADNIARNRTITLGNAGTDLLVEVVDGLSPTDRLIAGGKAGLSEGDRVVITGDDASIGTSPLDQSSMPDKKTAE